uniref:Ribosome maturation factor RimP C-terminal domain-containing protein n=1 Tax=Biomphalaria glabrata TaxID=6526 RepID=A0A2C9KVI6_BIOGL
MDIKQKLQSKFPEVNDAFFEKESSMLFLRVELTLRDFDAVVAKSQEISAYLDTDEPTEKEYFLDVYSAGTETKVDISELKDNLDKYVKVTLKNPIKSKEDFEGTLLEVKEDEVIIK